MTIRDHSLTVWRARPLTVATIGVAMLASACGSSNSSSPTTAPHPSGVLNVKRVELAITQSILTERHQHANVRCPKGVLQEQGLTFKCIATTHSDKRTIRTVFTVFQRNGRGSVYYQSPK